MIHNMKWRICTLLSLSIFLFGCASTTPEAIPAHTAIPSIPAPTPTEVSTYYGWLVFVAPIDEDLNELYLLSPNSGEVIPLGLSGLNPRKPSWSSDWQKIAFMSGGDIFVLDLECTDLARVCQDMAINITNDDKTRYDEPAWSPDGKKIAFYIFIPNEDGPYNTRGIGIINVDGTEENILPGTSLGSSPEWFLDRGQIGFLSFVSQTDRDFYLVDQDGTNSAFIFDFPQEYNHVGEWHISPDGMKIAISVTVWEPNLVRWPRIGLIDLNGENFEPFEFEAYSAVWSPDGKYLAFVDYSQRAHRITSEGWHNWIPQSIQLLNLDSLETELIYEGDVWDIAWTP